MECHFDVHILYYMITRNLLISLTALILLGSSQDWVRNGNTIVDFTENPLQQHIYAAPIFVDTVFDGANITFPFDATISFP